MKPSRTIGSNWLKWSGQININQSNTLLHLQFILKQQKPLISQRLLLFISDLKLSLLLGFRSFVFAIVFGRNFNLVSFFVKVNFQDIAFG